MLEAKVLLMGKEGALWGPGEGSMKGLRDFEFRPKPATRKSLTTISIDWSIS